MYPIPIQRLINHLQKLPGIGPKQAAKFAFRLIGMSQEELDLFSSDLENIKKVTAKCPQCRLTYTKDQNNLCTICRNKRRDQEYICVVETERDAYTIEKTKTFNGVYHVLGGKILEGTRELEKRIKKLPDSAEIIIATSATSEGGATALYVERALAPLNMKITRLGRGLSSGIEVEYADKDTLVDAFKNRK